MEVAVLLGGRHDGKRIDYCGSQIEFDGDTYIALRTTEGRVFYLLHRLSLAWFEGPGAWFGSR